MCGLRNIPAKDWNDHTVGSPYMDFISAESKTVGQFYKTGGCIMLLKHSCACCELYVFELLYVTM